MTNQTIQRAREHENAPLSRPAFKSAIVACSTLQQALDLAEAVEAYGRSTTPDQAHQTHVDMELKLTAYLSALNEAMGDDNES